MMILASPRSIKTSPLTSTRLADVVASARPTPQSPPRPVSFLLTILRALSAAAV